MKSDKTASSDVTRVNMCWLTGLKMNKIWTCGVRKK